LCAIPVIVLLLALPVLAADLNLKVDKDKKTVAVTNMLPTKVVMLYLVDPDKKFLPLYAQLAKGATVTVPLRFVMPKEIESATCEIVDPPKGYERGDDNHYHLTVELQ
jgi:hypothetical protein